MPQVIQVLLSSDVFAFFLLMVKYRYSYQNLCRPPGLLWIIIRLILHGFFNVSIEFMMRNVFLAPCLNGYLPEVMSCILCSTFLGSDIHLIFVHKHIFLSVGLFNLY